MTILAGAARVLLSFVLEIESALTLISLLSFAALIVTWIAAPLQEEQPTTAPATETTAHTIPA